MIELTFSTAFTLYLALTLSLLLGFWIRYHYRARRKVVLPSEQELFVCEYCHFVYLEQPTENINQCPQCRSFNKRNAYKTKKSSS
jgi:ribosomal protein L37AE/L43A